MTSFPPIRYDRRQVALMLEFAMFFSPDFGKQIGEIGARLQMIVVGIIAPTSAVLEHFELKVDGKGYVWNPR
jgi:hypothetical protein